MQPITKAELANNPPKHPSLQDLDLWTEDQLRDYIKSILKGDISYVWIYHVNVRNSYMYGYGNVNVISIPELEQLINIS